MDEAAVRVFWPPSPPAHAVTSVAVDVHRAWLYTGGSDGAIVRWHLQGAVAPKAHVMLVGHTRPIRHLAPGLKGLGPGGDLGQYLLSVDDGGGCCLWREPCGRCVLQRWIPELGSAIFGQSPSDRSGPLAASEWLLAALPAAGGEELALRPNPPHHIHHHHHHYHYQPNHHDHQPDAATPSLLHGVRSSGPTRQAEGEVGGRGGPRERTMLYGNRMKSSRGPVLLVIDWRSLSLIQVLDMQPLQQLVRVDMPTAADKFRFSSGGGSGSGSGRGSGGGGSSGGASSPTSQQRAVRPPWAECKSGDNSPDPSSVLLCLQWGPCAVPPGDGAGVGNNGSTDNSSYAGGPGGDAMVVTALALTPRGTLYGCVVPCDPYKPPAWVLGCGGARNTPSGGRVVGKEGAAGAGTRFVGAEQLLGPEGLEEPPGLLMEVHEPLLSAAVSTDLRWALLGALDSWIILEARWNAAQSQWHAMSMSTKTISTLRPLGTTGSHNAPPRLLHLSFTAKCRISLMHQPGAGMMAVAAGGLGLHSPQLPVIRTAAHLLLLGTWEEEEQPAAAGAKAAAGMAAAASVAESLVAAARQPYSISGMAGPAAATFITATATATGHAATATATTATTAATATTATTAATAAVTASPEPAEAGCSRPCELELHLARSGLALSSPAQPPRSAAAPNAATCSDSRTSPPSGSMAAVTAAEGIDAPRPPAPAAGTALTPTAAVAVAVAGSRLDQRVADYDDELLTRTYSPDLARLSFAVYLPPQSDGGSSAASSSVRQPSQAQSLPMWKKHQQQSQPQLQPQQQQAQVVLPLNGFAQVSSGAPAATDGLHGSKSEEGRCKGQAQQSQAQAPFRSISQQALQLQLLGLPPPIQKNWVSGMQVNLATAARGWHGGGGGGGSMMGTLSGHAGLQETLQKQVLQTLHGKGLDLSLTHVSAQLINHWRQRTNHHRHHHVHDASTRGAVVLQVLSWDGAGRQQIVSLTSDGRILAVQELSAAAPHAPATASFGTMEARQTGWPSPSCCSAPSPSPEALSCSTTAFCTYLPAQGGGDGICNIGAGDGNSSGSGSVGRGDGGGLAGWVLGVHCYHGDTRPATASVLQWPLAPQKSLPHVVQQASPLAAEAAAAIRAVSSAGMERPLTEANSVPLVGYLHDGWAAAAAPTWWAHTARRRRRSRAMQRHGCGRAGDGVATAALADHGSVWDSACEEGTDGGCIVRGTLRQDGGYEAVRDDRSDGRGSAGAVADDGGSRCGPLLDSEVIRVQRCIDIGKVTKENCSGSGFAATSAATTATTTIAGGGDSLYGPPAPPDVPGSHVGGGRIRRGSSGGGARRGLPACLYERWNVGQKLIPWSNGKRDCTKQPHDVLAVVRACNDEGVDVGSGSPAPTYTPAAVVSASVLVCDGTASGEAVVLHCTADGEMHYCDVGAYSVPSMDRWCTADDGFQHAPSWLLRAPVKGEDDNRHWQARDDGEGYGYGYDNSGGGGESSRISEPPVVMRSGRAGRMRGHIGPVTCQLEVLVSILPSGSAAGATANTASADPPSLSPSLASYIHLIPGGAARASGGVAAAGDGANGSESCAVRVLLTGGSDGSLRGWHTHAAMFGRPVFALHPHGAAVRRVLLPRGSETHAPPEFRQCVVSAAEDGSVALVCLERGCVLRVCRTYPYGMPEVVSWSFRRGFLACGGCDAMGQWTVAVFDIAPVLPSLDRIAVGSEAAAILDVGVAASTSAASTSAASTSAASTSAASTSAASTSAASTSAASTSAASTSAASTSAASTSAASTTLMLPSRPLPHIAPIAAANGSQTASLQQWTHHHLHQSPHMPQVSHQRQGGLHTHQPIQRDAHHSCLPPPVPHHHYHHNNNHQFSQGRSQNSTPQQYQQQRPPYPPGKHPSERSVLALQLLGRFSDGGWAGGSGGGSGGGGGGDSGQRSWVHSVPHVGSPGCTVPSASMPAPATLVAASSSTPNLAPAWAYGGSFRTIKCHRPDVLLAAIDSEALLAKLSAATRTPATSVTTAASSLATSSPVPMPCKPGARGLVVARSSNPCQPPYGLSRSYGIPYPTVASLNQLSISAYPSRRASLDSETAAAADAEVAAGSQDHAPASLPSTAPLAAAVAGRNSRGGASRFSLEADRSVGGRSIGGASAGSSRLSLDETSAANAPRIDLSDKKALAALISMLHPWTSDPRVDRSVEKVLVLLGVLLGHRDGDPWVSDGSDGGREDPTATSMACFNDAVATHGSVSWHRSPSAPEGQFAFDSEGNCRLGRNGTSSAAAGNDIGGDNTGTQCATTVAVGPAAGVGGLSVGCSPQGGSLHGETLVSQPRGHIPDIRLEAESDDGQFGDTSTAPCLVQPALVSACGSVALAMPQAPEIHGADSWVIGDATAAAARLLHIVSLAGALGMVGEQGEPPAVLEGTICRAAVRASSCVRHMCLVTARDAVAADRAAGVQLPPTQAHLLTSSPPWSCPRLHEPDLAMFARCWLAPDPWVREAARQLLSAYTKPWVLDTAASVMSVPVAAAAQPPPPFPPLFPPAGEVVAAHPTSAGVPGKEVGSSPPPLSVLLPSQAMQLLLLRNVVTSESSQSEEAANAAPQQHRCSRRPSGTAPSQLPPPPQRLYPAAIIAAAACIAHPDAVPRHLFAAAAASLVELLCLPLTLQSTSAESASAGAVVTDAPTAVQSAIAHQQAVLQPPPRPPPPQQQQQSSGLWVDGQVLLPEVAAAMLTAALSGLAAAQWRQQLQPWARFVDRVLHLIHVIPLPSRGTRAVSHNAAVTHPAAAGAHGPMGHTPHCHYPPGSLPHAAPAATPQRAARQLADQAVTLLATAAELDMEAMLAGMSRFAGGESLPLHPLVAAALTRLATRCPGRRCLAAVAPALGALLASCAAAPATRGRPDLARPAYLLAADVAAALPCAALHANSVQLAVAPPLAAASPLGEPQYVIVYDLEHGNATWQLPLQPGPGALQPLPAAVAGTLGTSAAAVTAIDAGASSSMATVVAVTGGGRGSGGGGGGGRSSLPCPASSLPEVLRAVGRGGVAALQFSPQGDHLAVLVMDGTPTPALLVYSLNLPWSHKLLMLPGAARPALVVQPCHCWLLPGLLQLIQPPPSPLLLRQPKQQQEHEEDSRRNQQEPQQQLERGGASAWSGCAAAGEAVGAAGLSSYGRPGGCAGEDEVGRKEGVAEERKLGAGLRNCVQMQDEGPETGRGQEGWHWPQANSGDRHVRLVHVIDKVFGLRWSGQSCVELLRNRTAILARFVLPVGA